MTTWQDNNRTASNDTDLVPTKEIRNKSNQSRDGHKRGTSKHSNGSQASKQYL
jgi:hypothetical protein